MQEFDNNYNNNYISNDGCCCRVMVVRTVDSDFLTCTATALNNNEFSAQDDNEIIEQDSALKSPKNTNNNGKQGAKSVHFADTKGLALASIFHFVKDSTEESSRRKILAYFRDNNIRDPGSPARLLNFKSAVPYTEVQGHLTTRNVCLESAVCHKFGIYGRIYVRNLGYEKTVLVRYTFDAWQTVADEHANYIPGTSTGETDSFFFYIKPPKTSENKKMEFAICYRVAGLEFWDNNHGDDYRLVYYKTDTVDVPITNELSSRNI